MRLMFHIFKKDARRLWWEIAVSLATLALLTMYDSTRTDAVPGPMEGYLNLLLLFAWGLVAAFLIHDEALVGDRQFWVTRPYPRHVLLGAKALALLAFVHLPYLASQGVIVAVRGFNPLDYLPALLWKQFLLALAFTLPVAALAAVTRNLMQLVPAAVAILVAVTVLSGGVRPMRYPWEPAVQAQELIPLFGVAVVAIAVFCLQYARRRTHLARTLAVAALLAAALVFALLPREYVFRVQCLLDGAPVQSQPSSATVSIETELVAGRDRPLLPVGAVELRIPVRVSGLGQPPGTGVVDVEQLGMHVQGPNGEQWTATRRFNRVRGDGWTSFSRSGAGSLYLALDRHFYDRVKGAEVTIRGKVGIALYRWGAGHTIPAISDARPVPDVGRCYGIVVEYPPPGALKTVCESPSSLPLFTRVNLIQAGGGEVWEHWLADAATVMRYLVLNVLSPMNRAQTFFQFASWPRGPASQWLVPGDVLPSATVELIPGERTGSMVFSYEIRNVALTQFSGRSVRRRDPVTDLRAPAP